MGLKHLLDTEGPEAVSKWVLSQKKLLVTDTTMRDAHQSLLSTRMRTRDMVKGAEGTADFLADCFSLEMWGGATFDTAYRFLYESPWERLVMLREKIPNIPFQMLLRGSNLVGYASYPDNLVHAFIEESAKAGIDVFRVFDSLNWIPSMETAMEAVLKQEIGIPIHLHTHNTTDNQIASYLLAAEAGADIVDCAIGPLSSLTSQPSINSLVEALRGTERDTGIDPEGLQKLSDYWSDIRERYSGFDKGLRTPVTDIYKYEIPGGQYTNLQPQVEALGLGHRFEDVKEMYRTVNDMLGDIIKVTPSSKMVGDLAIFMVQNELTPENIVKRGESLAFPDSVVSYFKGMMGQPPCGFPEELPKVLEDYFTHRKEYGYIMRMGSHVFFNGMAVGETTTINIEDGKTLVIKYLGLGDRNEDGTRNVQFELNGSRREVAVPDPQAPDTSRKVRMADPEDKSQIGASIPGMVSKLSVKPGEEVKANQVVAIIEAMKMETSVVALTDGRVGEIFIEPGRSVKAGELLMTIV